MSEPVIVAKKPIVVELKPGTYAWCSCGRSKNEPFCDGSHVGTEFTPVRFEVVEGKKVALCQCKHTKRPPFCDGAHTRL